MYNSYTAINIKLRIMIDCWENGQLQEVHGVYTIHKTSAGPPCPLPVVRQARVLNSWLQVRAQSGFRRKEGSLHPFPPWLAHGLLLRAADRQAKSSISSTLSGSRGQYGGGGSLQHPARTKALGSSLLLSFRCCVASNCPIVIECNARLEQHRNALGCRTFCSPGAAVAWMPDQHMSNLGVATPRRAATATSARLRSCPRCACVWLASR